MSDKPKLTREQFIAEFRNHLTGLIWLGHEQVRKTLSGPIVSADDVGREVNEKGPTVDKLLGRMYDFMFPPAKPKPGA